MNYNKRLLLSALLVLSTALVFSQLIILSGPEKGSYNRFAGDISALVYEKTGIIIENRISRGSAFNYEMLTGPNPNYKLALIQSDYLKLMEAEDKLKDTDKAAALKIVMPLATEQFHLAAKKSSGLTRLQDLDKKRVGIGNKNQGTFATGKIIRERSQIDWTTVTLGFDAMLSGLSAGSIDAGLFVGSSPLNMLDIDPRVMVDGITLIDLDDFNGWARHYENDTIYSEDYKWLDKDISTFGVRTLLIVNEFKLTDEDKKTLAVMKSNIIQNLDHLRKKGHPRWKTVIIPDEPGIKMGEKTTESRTPDAPAADSKNKITYKVQIYSRNYKRENDQVSINDKSYEINVYFHLEAYRYTVGEFTSLSDATELQFRCREEGYSQAFVAAFINNVRSNNPDLF